MLILEVLFAWAIIFYAVVSGRPHEENFKRSLDQHLGLNATNLHRSGIAIGFLPGFGQAVAPNLPRDINDKLPAPMAIMGNYVKLETADPNLSLIDNHLPDLQGLEGNPIWEIALMPEEGLDKVTKRVAKNIAKKMLQLNNRGITVWLRFAHEMNGDWYTWGQQPELFVKKWRMVAHAVKSRTENTYMLWAPNSAFGESLDSVRGGYTKYWPGVDTVDISGLSYYHYGGYERLNVLPSPGEAIGLIRQFSKLYGRGQHRSVVLAETGASYTTSLQTGKPAEGGASQYAIKYRWLKQLLSSDMRNQLPELKAIVWFEIVKDENAAGDSPVKREDFRLILGEERLSQNAVTYLKRK